MISIGYGAYDPTLCAPGDRRRFVAWAKQRSLPFEPASLFADHDVVYLTHHSDLGGWLARKQAAGHRLKLIFELVDSYFTQTNLPRRIAKAAVRRLIGTDTRYHADFLATLGAICRAADAVICSTEEQRVSINRFNPNVHVSLDYFADELHVVPPPSTQRPLKVVWEGQVATLGNLLQVSQALNALADAIELHVVTDPVQYRLLKRFWARPTQASLAGFRCPVVFHPWRIETFSSIVSSCDVAIIPIDLDDAMARGKPENKLIMLWQCGLPVLTSPTPAYCRAMAANGVDALCSSRDDWVRHLRAMADMTVAERNAARTILRERALERYSAAAFREPFDAAFSSIGLPLLPVG